MTSIIKLLVCAVVLTMPLGGCALLAGGVVGAVVATDIDNGPYYDGGYYYGHPRWGHDDWRHR